MRIAIGISTFTSLRGGGERVAANLAAAMQGRGHEVTLYAFALNGSRSPQYPLAPGVRLFTLERWHSRADVAHLRQQLEECRTDVFISMSSSSDHLLWATACLGTGIPFVYSEHTHPTRVETLLWNRPGRLAAVSCSDAIHLLLPCHAASVPEQWRYKVRIIPHARPESVLPANPVKNNRHRKTLLYLARLVPVKRPHLLLQAFHLLSGRYEDWDLVIWGTGSEEHRLRKIVSSWDLEDRIHFCGFCNNPSAAYADAQLYCLPSSFEGFGLTMLEAMSAGLPVVGVADCMTMRELIVPGVNGLLATEPTPYSLATRLQTLMSDSSMRCQLGAGARQTAARYAPQTIYDQWETLLTDMAARKGATMMEGIATEHFVTQSTLFHLARQEWLFRPAGAPLPGSVTWAGSRMRMLNRNIRHALKQWIRRLVC